MPEPTPTRADYDAVFVPNYAPADALLARGSGSRVWDTEGKEYVDFASGIAVNALGHAHPDLVEALTAQAASLWHVSNAYTHAPGIALAQSLTARTFADRVLFCNSGAEANEAALKLARRYAYDRGESDRFEIISFDRSFHGRTFLTVSAGGTEAYRTGFGPVPEGLTHLPYNDMDAVDDAVTERTAAILVEPVQGEGGLTPADAAFLARLRDLCTANGALLIFDEVQSGVGRTGWLYAYQAYDVVPDILTTAKGLGGGFPIGAMLTTDEVAQSFVPGTHGSTFGGNPLASAVAARVLELVDDADFLGEVRRKEATLRERLLEVGTRRAMWHEVRGMGLWLGCVLDGPWAGRAGDIAKAAFEAGVMVLRAGADVVRLAPALNIPDADIEEGVARLDDALDRLD
jgi:acetylornithine/N-succinyldiaminopimelate aminotransferase